MSDKSRTESELWDAIETIAHGQAAMVAAEYGLGEQREYYVTNHALRNLLKGLVREARERSAGAAPPEPITDISVLSIPDLTTEEVEAFDAAMQSIKRNAGAAPDVELRHREAMTLLRMASPRMAIGGAATDAWLHEVAAFLRAERTDR